MIDNALPTKVQTAWQEMEGRTASVRSWIVYALSTRFLHRPAGAAKPVGYQFVERDCRRSRLFETPLAPGSAIHEITGILADKVEQALGRADEFVEREGRDGLWELRSLRVPALYLEALWLHSRTGSNDIVVPYSSFDQDIREDQYYRLTVFLNLAASAAERLGTQAP